MSEILVSIDNDKYDKSFIALLKDLKNISSYEKLPTKAKKLKPLTDEDWVRPGRQATEEEIIKMLEEAEKEPLLSLEEAKAQTLKRLSELQANRK